MSAATGAVLVLEEGGESSWNGFGMSLRPTDGNDFSCGGCLGSRVDGFIPVLLLCFVASLDVFVFRLSSAM